MKRFAFSLGCCGAIALVAVVVSAQGDATPDQLRQALAQKTQALGQCNAELGSLQQLQAKVIGGQVADVATIVAQIRAQFEKANAGKTFDAEFKMADKPVEKER